MRNDAIRALWAAYGYQVEAFDLGDLVDTVAINLNMWKLPE